MVVPVAEALAEAPTEVVDPAVRFGGGVVNNRACFSQLDVN